MYIEGVVLFFIMGSLGETKLPWWQSETREVRDGVLQTRIVGCISVTLINPNVLLFTY